MVLICTFLNDFIDVDSDVNDETVDSDTFEPESKCESDKFVEDSIDRPDEFEHKEAIDDAADKRGVLANDSELVNLLAWVEMGVNVAGAESCAPFNLGANSEEFVELL